MTVPQSDGELDAWLNQDANRELSADYSDWKLDPVRQALKALALRPFPRPITVAGTKGKGSTVAFLEAILSAHGRRPLAFSSPHVLSLRERWRLDGQPCELASLTRHCPAIDAAVGSGCATYFERSFLLACCLAAELAAEPMGCTFVCEVGIGGRLDCANVLDAAIVCLSSLGLDHTQILGPTLHHIAAEKLGVCRPDAPLFIAAQSPAALTAINEQLPIVRQATHIPALDPCPTLGLPGAHQAANAALALAACEHRLAGDYQHPLAVESLAKAQLPGRCQELTCGERHVIIDGAHTAESMAATVAHAQKRWADDWAMIFGVAGDKDIAAIISTLPSHLQVLRCGYQWARCAGPQHPAWPALSQQWPWCSNIQEALNHPAIAHHRHLLISGSFYLAGEALAHLQHHP